MYWLLHILCAVFRLLLKTQVHEAPEGECSEWSKKAKGVCSKWLIANNCQESMFEFIYYFSPRFNNSSNFDSLPIKWARIGICSLPAL